MRNVVISGIGCTNIGHFPTVQTYSLATEAITTALKDAGVAWKDIQCAFCGNEDGGNAAGHLALSEMGYTGIPIINIENACSSGTSAFRLAYNSVAYGQYDIVLALGFEKMPSGAIPSTAFPAWQLKMGFNFQPANYALECMEYFHETGATIDDVSRVAVKNRKHGALNPYARYQKPVTMEEVSNSRPICTPFHLLHCSPTSDGAVALIVCSQEKAKELSRAVKIKAATLVCGVYGDAFYQNGLMYSQKYRPEEGFTELSANEAYNIAGIGPEDIDVIQAYDSMAASELWDLEKLGFCKTGEAPKLMREGYFDLGGKKPCNTDGGIMARGHAIGATGGLQIYEIVKQLRGEAGPRQVEGARLGLTHAMGAGPNSAVVILEKPDRA